MRLTLGASYQGMCPGTKLIESDPLFDSFTRYDGIFR